jgi:sugar lactone lactonase YvrE
MKFRVLLIVIPCLLSANAESILNQPFPQEARTSYAFGAGLPGQALPDGSKLANVTSIELTDDGRVVAAAVSTFQNIELLEFDGQMWRWLTPFFEHVSDSDAHSFAASTSGRAYRSDNDAASEDKRIVDGSGWSKGSSVVATAGKVWEDKNGKRRVAFTADEVILSVAAGPEGGIAVGTVDALYLRVGAQGKFDSLFPSDEKYSWDLRNVSAVVFDSKGRLWFGSDLGVGVLDGNAWHLYTGDEGLPYDHFTCATVGENGAVWFGTERGAIRFDGDHWSYRASLRWLPDDYVNDIAVEPDGSAWIATRGGISHILRGSMTLESKAAYFTNQVETRHNRDGYITNWRLERRGDVTNAVPGITDNDGLYTSWYGAAMAFRYAVTKDPEAKALANRSFDACKRLVDIVPESMKGFPARVLIPIDWPEPVNEILNDEFNRKRREDDPFWKLITPRFVTSEDGKYLWKCDTSSDELAGHYFFYGVYYDLVAETEEEKAPVREVVRDITDHLIRNDFNLVDHDGTPTRWGRFGPDFLDSENGWPQRGLNSLMMLGMLAVADHVTGDAKYAETAQMLREKHGYHINMMMPRPTFPPSNVVPWDNNLGLLCFYPLMQYENDPELLILYRQSLEDFWQFISRQKNPFWNFAYGAGAQRFASLVEQNHFEGAFPDSGPYAAQYAKRFATFDCAIEDSLDTLRHMPLELIGWEMKNSHRLDVELDPTPTQERDVGWSKVDRKALPIEERSHVRQDRDGFKLDAKEDDGWSEHEGTFYLLPYYMGRYHGFIE